MNNFKGVRCIWTCNECDKTVEAVSMKPINGVHVPKPFHVLETTQNDGEHGTYVLCLKHYRIWMNKFIQENPNAVWST